MEVYPTLGIATAPSWNSVARAYHQVVEQQLAETELRRVARKQVKGLRNLEDPAQRRQAVDRLLAWLHRSIRYTGLELGEAAIVPRTPEETRERGYGDCKDKSTFLVALLREVGIEARVVLLRVGQRRDVEAELPGFDHAIVYLPGEDLWIDPTHPQARAGELPTSAQGRWALIAGPETEGLVRTPEAAAAENRTVEKRHVKLRPLGSARLDFEAKLEGHMERAYRSYWETLAGEERDDFFEGMASRNLADEVLDWQVQGEADLVSSLVLKAELDHSRLAKSDLGEANVRIPYGNLFRRLPETLKEDLEEEGDDEEAEGEAPPWPRSHDLYLPYAHREERHYRITPAPGYYLAEGMEDTRLALGPGSFERMVKVEEDGAVQVTLAFETGPRRLSPDEAEAMRAGVVEILEEGALELEFDNRAAVAMAAGQLEEAIRELRSLIALHPKDGLLRARLAQALVEAGLGSAARKEIGIAAELSPDLARVHTLRGIILQRDLIGRLMTGGHDHDGATAAFRRALELEPQEGLHYTNLARHLQVSAQGVLRGTGAQLEEAIEVLQERREELGSSVLDEDLGINLLYTGQVEAALELAEEEEDNRSLTAVRLAAIALSQGAEAALEEAWKITDADDRQRALRSAGNFLLRPREYALAGKLLEASAVGSGSAAERLRWATLVGRTVRHEELPATEDPLLSFERRLYRTLLQYPPGEGGAPEDGDELDTMISQRLSPEERQELRERLGWEAKGDESLPLETRIDLQLSPMEVSTEGDEQGGYRVRVRSSEDRSRSQIHFLVMEDGEPRLVGRRGYLSPVGKEVLRHLDAGDPEAAERWLNWARREVSSRRVADDPYGGTPFAHLWRLGKTAPPEKMRLAAAALMAYGPTAAEALAILEPALLAALAGEGEPSEEFVDGLGGAVLVAYRELDQWEPQARIAQRLLERSPESQVAFADRLTALTELERWQEIDSLAEQRLRDEPGKAATLRLLATSAVARGDLSAARGYLEEVVAGEDRRSGDFDDLAWYRLVAGDLDDTTINLAEKAVSSAQESASSSALHTLASIYAEVGRLREARTLLHQALARRSERSQVESVDWYVVGRIAEQYGLPATAREAYLQARPEEPDEGVASTWTLAQRRLELLGAEAAEELPEPRVSR